MEKKDLEMMKTKFEVGDIVVVPVSLAGLTHDKKVPMVAEVVGKYRHFFNIKYKIVKREYERKCKLNITDNVGTYVLLNGNPEMFKDSTFEQSILWKDANKVRNVTSLVAMGISA